MTEPAPAAGAAGAPASAADTDADKKKKRQFRKFTYRGVDLEQLLDMNMYFPFQLTSFHSEPLLPAFISFATQLTPSILIHFYQLHIFL